jgi:hypothetical protein
LRKALLTILVVAVASMVAAGDVISQEYTRVSFTGSLASARMDLGELQEQIDVWNAWMVNASEVDQGIGSPQAEEIGVGYSLVGDIRYRLGPRFVLALRLEYLTDNSSTLATIFGNEFSAAGAPITLTGLFEFPGVLPSVLRKAKLNLGVGGGIVARGIYKFEFFFPLDNHMTARATSRGYQLHTMAEIEYPFLERWGIVGEVMYRYTGMGDLVWGSVSGATEQIQNFWEGVDTGFPGIFEGVPFPEEGADLVYTPEGDVMNLDFSGFSFRVGLRFYLY